MDGEASTLVTGPSPGSVLQPARLGELPHRFFLVFGELLGDLYVDLDDEVALRSVLLESVSTHTKSLSVRSARRNPNRDSLAVESAHTDAGTECRLRNIDRHWSDDIE